MPRTESITNTPDATTSIKGKSVILGGTSAVPTVPIGSVTGFGANVATFLATPTSANFAAAVTGETGTGNVVFSDTASLTGTITLTGDVNFTGTQPANVGTTPGTAATDYLLTGGIGGTSTAATGVGGIGGDFTFTAGDGGLASGATSSTGGKGGVGLLNGGLGGAPVAGATRVGGAGGAAQLFGGIGGSVSGGGTANNGGAGGNATIQAGKGGTGTTAPGTAGTILMQTSTTSAAFTTKLTIGSATMTIADNIDIAVGATNGTIIGTATTQKIGFFAHAPTAQPATPAATAAAIITALQSLGLVA